MESSTLIVQKTTKGRYFRATFPQDVLDEVVDHLSDDLSSLKTCSLTSKPFLHSSRPHLFRQIHVSDAEALMDFLVFVSTRSVSLLYIRDLTICGCPRGSGLEVVTFPTLPSRTTLEDGCLRSVVAHLPHLRVLKLMNFLLGDDFSSGGSGTGTGTTTTGKEAGAGTRLRFHCLELQLEQCVLVTTSALSGFLRRFGDIQNLKLKQVYQFKNAVASSSSSAVTSSSSSSATAAVAASAPTSTTTVVHGPLLHSRSLSTKSDPRIKIHTIQLGFTYCYRAAPFEKIAQEMIQAIDTKSVRAVVVRDYTRTNYPAVKNVLQAVGPTLSSLLLDVREFFGGTSHFRAERKYTMHMEQFACLETLEIGLCMDTTRDSWSYFPLEAWEWLIDELTDLSSARPPLHTITIKWYIISPFNGLNMISDGDWNLLDRTLDKFPFLKKVEFVWDDGDGFLEGEEEEGWFLDDLVPGEPEPVLGKTAACEFVKMRLEEAHKKGLLMFYHVGPSA